MTLVFVSHATADNAYATRLHHALTAAGLESWVDHERGIESGDNWSRAIQEALNACDCLILALSPTSAKSPECEAEYRRAMSLDKRVYPVLIEAIPKADFPWRLGTIQYTNLIDDFDGGIAELARAIKARGGIDPNAPTSVIARKITARPPIDLRLLTIPMHGRDKDAKDIIQALQTAPVTIAGIGGLGKSRMAAHLALTLDGLDGVVWHTCNEFSTVETPLELLRDHFGLPVTATRTEIVAPLRRHKLLLVIDNGESVEDAARRKDYADLMGEARQMGTPVLLTSRTAWAELKGGRTHALPNLPPDPAAQVVVSMAAHFEVNGVDGRADEIAAKARKHPRLIEWAVGKMTYAPVERVLRELDALKSPDAQDALNEMIGSTFEQMSNLAEGEDAADALRKLNVCRGGFTYEAALAILETDEDMLDGWLKILTRYQFVTLRDGRYDIDPLVVAAVGADDSAREVHLNYYQALAKQHDKKQDYAGLDIESENLTAAFDWAADEAERVAQSVGARHAAPLQPDLSPNAALARAYWFYNACHHFLGNRGRFDPRKAWLERLVPLLRDDSDGNLRAAIQNSLGLVYGYHPTGSRRDNLHHAIDAYHAALVYRTPAAAPLDYAKTQNNLGNAYAHLAALENQADNLRRAIDCYREALVYYTPAAAPLDYAMTQNNLGATYSDLAALEDRADNLQRAIDCYREALVYRTPDSAPLGYAGTQNNLGNAYRSLAALEDRADNQRRAIDCFRAALVYWTPDAAPLNYAMTQYNLGNSYVDLAALEDQADNLRRAIDTYCEALVYRTPDAAPLDYAMTQNNLGVAYHKLAALEDRADNLRRAIECYRAALVYYTPDAAPLYYAMTQDNLGIVYENLGDIDAAVGCWREAERYYRQMGYTDDADKMLRWIAWAEGGSGGS